MRKWHLASTRQLTRTLPIIRWKLLRECIKTRFTCLRNRIRPIPVFQKKIVDLWIKKRPIPSEEDAVDGTPLEMETYGGSLSAAVGYGLNDCIKVK